MRCLRRSVAALGVMVLVAACSRAPHTGNEPPPRTETAVRVVNQSYLDMNVYLVRGGQRLRIGTVTGLTTQVFILRPDMIGPPSMCSSRCIRLAAAATRAARGSRRTPATSSS